MHLQFAATLIAIAFVFTGCQPAADTADTEDSKPEATETAAPEVTLKESLEKVTMLAAKIGEGMDAGDMDKAHGPIHKITPALKKVPNLIDSSDLADELKTKLGSAIDSLIGDFKKVDNKLHDKENGADYADVKESIEAALETVNSAIESLN